MTDNLFTARLRPMSKEGDVEIVRLMLFTPDGEPLDLSNVGPGGSSSIPVVPIASAGPSRTLVFPAHGEKIYILNLTELCTITLDGSDTPDDEGAYITLLVTSNGYGLEWADDVSWANDEAPLLSDQRDLLTLLSLEGGAQYCGGRGLANLSVSTTPPEPSAPVVTSDPTISGSATAGSTLTRTVGAADGYPTPTPTTQWRKDGEAIPGATSSTHVTDDPDDVDGVIDVEITWANGVSPDATANSNDITVTASGGGGGGGGVFAQLTSPAAGLLTSASPEVGGPMTMHPSYSGAGVPVVTAAHRVRSGDSATSVAMFAGSPDVDDYTITFDLVRLAEFSWYTGVAFRLDPTSDDYYAFVFDPNITYPTGGWKIIKYLGGVQSQVGSSVLTSGAFTTFNGEIHIVGPHIVVKIGGTTIIDVVDDTDPLVYSADERVGVWFYNTTGDDVNGVQVANILATT